MHRNFVISYFGLSVTQESRGRFLLVSEDVLSCCTGPFRDPLLIWGRNWGKVKYLTESLILWDKIWYIRALSSKLKCIKKKILLMTEGLRLKKRKREITIWLLLVPYRSSCRVVVYIWVYSVKYFVTKRNGIVEFYGTVNFE